MTRISSKLGRYWRLTCWFLRDALWRHRILVVGIMGGGFLALAAQVQAIALTIYYAKLLVDGEPLVFRGVRYDTQDSLTPLVVVAGIVVVMLLLSALLQYGSRVWTLRLRRDYGAFCSHRILDVLRAAPASIPVTPLPFTEADASRLARADSIRCGRVASLIVNAMTPALSLILAAGVLFAIDALLTGVLVVLAAIGALFIYRFNHHAAAHGKAYEDAIPAAGAEVRQAIRASNRLGPMEPEPDGERAMPALATLYDKLVARLRSADDSEFVGNVILAIAIPLILGWLGVQIIRGGEGLQAIVYLVATRYALVMFRQVARILTSMNKFHPQASRYRAFIADAAAARDTTPPDDYKIVVRRPTLPDSLPKAVIEPGDRLVLVTSLPLDRYTLPFFLRSLLPGRNGGADAAIATACGLATRGTDEDDEAPALVAAAEALDPAPGSWVFVDGAALAPLPPSCTERVLEHLGGAIVVIVSDDSFPVALEGDWLAAVVDDTGLRGLGSAAWLNAQRDQLPGRVRAVAADVLDDDEDEDLL